MALSESREFGSLANPSTSRLVIVQAPLGYDQETVYARRGLAEKLDHITVILMELGVKLERRVARCMKFNEVATPTV